MIGNTHTARLWARNVDFRAAEWVTLHSVGLSAARIITKRIIWQGHNRCLFEAVAAEDFLERRCVMIEVPQNGNMLSKVVADFHANAPTGDDSLFETTSAAQEERYFLEGPKSRRSELLMTLITDSVEEAMRHIQRHAVEQFGLQRRKVTMRRSWLLRE